MKFDSFIISKEATVLEAMKKITASPKDILFICDKLKAVAVITSKDIIEYLIDGKNTDNILKAANKEFDKAFLSNRLLAKKLIKDKKLKAVPVLDTEHNILEIVLENGESVRKENNLSLPIMLRLEKKYDFSKAINIDKEKKILSNSINKFKPYFCDNFTFLTSLESSFQKFIIEELKKDADSINISTKSFIGSAGALKDVSKNIDSTFIISTTDKIVEYPYEQIYSYHKKNENLVTIVTTQKTIEVPYEIIDVDKNNKISLMQTKPHFTFIVSTGFYILEPEFIEYIPDNPKLPIESIIKICLRSEKKVGIYQIPENCFVENK